LLSFRNTQREKKNKKKKGPIMRILDFWQERKKTQEVHGEKRRMTEKEFTPRQNNKKKQKRLENREKWLQNKKENLHD